MQLVELTQAEFGRYGEDNLERFLAAPMGVSLDWTSMLRRDWEHSGVCEPGRQTSRCAS